VLDEKYLKGNIEAAKIIAARRDKYQPGSLCVAWADRILEHEAARKETEARERWKKTQAKPDEPLFTPPEAA
jgi:hypothetical protein